ncbi:MAG: DUF4268 domain-containing protein [Planctomycetes bacterium]|nr:DUF4268 domain-containing protein [Planctomycetota bacterium]
MQFGNISNVDLKSIWPSEATDFTPWLSQNISVISDKIGMELELQEVEADAGGFSADIVARDISTNKIVIIENQFGTTDHKHLGQIITYASVLGASTVIWIAESLRSEHKAAIDFLNQNLKDTLKFFALEVSLIKIDNSNPAYIFSVVSQPLDHTTAYAKTVIDSSETMEKYRAYFQALIDELRNVHKFTNAKVGQPQSWYTFASEKSKLYKYAASFAMGDRVRAEIYIDSGVKEQNESLFDFLFKKKEQIEKSFGSSLEWERLDTKRACRIARYRDGSIDEDTETIEDIRKWTIENLLKFKTVFPSIIKTWKPEGVTS